MERIHISHGGESRLRVSQVDKVRNLGKILTGTFISSVNQSDRGVTSPPSYFKFNRSFRVGDESASGGDLFSI